MPCFPSDSSRNNLASLVVTIDPIRLSRITRKTYPSRVLKANKQHLFPLGSCHRTTPQTTQGGFRLGNRGIFWCLFRPPCQRHVFLLEASTILTDVPRGHRRATFLRYLRLRRIFAIGNRILAGPSLYYRRRGPHPRSDTHSRRPAGEKAARQRKRKEDVAIRLVPERIDIALQFEPRRGRRARCDGRGLQLHHLGGP